MYKTLWQKEEVQDLNFVELSETSNRRNHLSPQLKDEKTAYKIWVKILQEQQPQSPCKGREFGEMKKLMEGWCSQNGKDLGI